MTHTETFGVIPGLVVVLLTAEVQAQQLQGQAAVVPVGQSGLVTVNSDDGAITLQLERFQIIAPGAECVLVGGGGASSSHALDADRVQLFRGQSADLRFDAVIAQSESGAMGLLLPRGGGEVLTLVTDATALAVPDGVAGARPGLREGPWRFQRQIGHGGIDSPQLCGVSANWPGNGDPSAGDSGAGGLAGGGLSGAATLWPRTVELALDADFEFTSIFPNAQAAEDYLVALYGINSAILNSGTGVRLSISYIRLWVTADDPFNDPNPLGQFRTHWNSLQGGVIRDLAQLVTGRRNLPYGGVAWLNAVCTDSGYSVAGYMNGSIADATLDNPGNWDINVTAHELGHNVGTLHTHDYGLDSCNSGEVRRAGLMSYCHTVSGASANVDLRFERVLRDQIQSYMAQVSCAPVDCDEDGVADAEGIAAGLIADANGDLVPDSCQDCDADGVLDPLAILAGAPDLDGNGRPDHCDADCNASGVPDSLEIALGVVEDAYLNGIPDSCEVDCDSDGVSDYTEINTIGFMINDRSRDAQIDSCQDCDGDGATDTQELGGALGLWCVQSGGSIVYELHGRSGVRVRSAPTTVDGMVDILIGPDGGLFALGINSLTGAPLPAISRLDRAVGDSEMFTGPHALLGTAAPAMCFRSDGVLLVVSASRKAVVMVDQAGLPIADLVPPTAGLIEPRRCRVDSQATLFVLDGSSTVLMFDAWTGQPLGALGSTLPPEAGVIADIECDGAGRVFFASPALDAILAIDRHTGNYLGRFDVGPNPTSTVALRDPTAMKLGPRGDVLLVAATGTAATIHGFRLADGYYQRTYRVYDFDAPAPTALAVVGPSPLDVDMDFLLDACDHTPPPTPDLNGDGRVDGADMAQMLSMWEQAPGVPNADLDRDGIIGGGDLANLIASWTP